MIWMHSATCRVHYPWRVWALLLLVVALSSVAAAEDSLVTSLKTTTQGLADAISRANGWDRANVSIGAVDTWDAQIGRGLAYSFRIEEDGAQTDLSFSEPLSSWEFLFADGELERAAGEEDGDTALSLLGSRRPGGSAGAASLPPFELAGPLELWIQDAQQLRLTMPHEVDAGELRKVVLAEGALVRVHGAQSVSLARPLQLPLPIVSGPEDRPAEATGVAAGLLALSGRLRAAARSQSLAGGSSMRHLVSLRVVSPTSLEAVGQVPLGSLEPGGGENGSRSDADGGADISSPSVGRLKVKRLSSTAVELRRPSQVASPGWPAEVATGGEGWAWPLPGVAATDPRLVAIEAALGGALGGRARERGSFRILSASAEPLQVVRVEFEAERRLGGSNGGGGGGAGGAAAAEAALAAQVVGTALSSLERQVWEMTARVDAKGGVQPIQVRQVAPLGSTVSLAVTDVTVNGTLVETDPQVLPPLGMSVLGEGLP